MTKKTQLVGGPQDGRTIDVGDPVICFQTQSAAGVEVLHEYQYDITKGHYVYTGRQRIDSPPDERTKS